MANEPNQPGRADRRTRRIRTGLAIGSVVAVVMTAIIGATTGNWALGIGVGVAIGAGVFTAFVAGTSRT